MIDSIMTREILDPSLFKLIIIKLLRTELFTIGQTPITVLSLGIALATFILLILLSKVITRILSKRIFSKLHIEPAKICTMKRMTYYVLVALSLIISLGIIGVNLRGLTVVFGLLSVGIGFGLQNITSNFISGLILLFERHVEIGSTVTVGDTLGDVVEINMRSTTIRTLQNIAIIVPNSDFVTSQVINWSYGDSKIRLDIDVGVSYNSDLNLVNRALLEVANENGLVLSKPQPDVLFRNFGDSAWEMSLRVWVKEPRGQFKIRSQLLSAIVHKFRKYNIEIPFPQRDLHLRSAVQLPVQIPEGRQPRAESSAD